MIITSTEGKYRLDLINAVSLPMERIGPRRNIRVKNARLSRCLLRSGTSLLPLKRKKEIYVASNLLPH